MLHFWDFFWIAVIVSVFAGGAARVARDQIKIVNLKLDRILKHLGEMSSFYEPSDEVKRLADDPKTKEQARQLYVDQTGLDCVKAGERIEAYLRSKT